MRSALLLFTVLLMGEGSALAQNCVAAREMVASARARVRPESSKTVLEDAVQVLRRAADLCPGFGDAYYFLSLLATQLKDARAEAWRLRAESYGSEAMKAKEPLILAAAAPAPAPTASPARPPAAAAVAAAAPATVTAVDVPRVPPYVRKKLALVVGVGRFKDPKINPLRFTTADAVAFADVLRDASGFDHVTLLLDEQATTYNVKTEIEQLAKMAAPEDMVVIYFASHGSPENLDTAGVNYIVTYDTEVDNLYPTAYRMDDLTDDIGGRIKAERVVAFLDTCYSGGTFRELPPGWVAGSRALTSAQGVAPAALQNRLKSGSRAVMVNEDNNPRDSRIAQGVGRVIITASSQSERSWEHDRIKHGYFTYFLLESLKQPSPVSIEDIFADLRVKVPEAVRQERGESQHPTIARSRDRVDLYLREPAKPGSRAPTAP